MDGGNQKGTEQSQPAFYKSWLPLALALIALAVLPLFLIYDRPRGLALDNVQKSGILRVLTLNSPTTYYEGPNGPAGFEFDLARGLADRLKVKLVMETTDTVGSVFPRLLRGDAQLAAAGLIVSGEREQLARFTPPYQQIEHQVVYLRGRTKPRKIEDLIGRDITVVAGSSVVQRLNELKAQHPELVWTETSEKDADRLLYEVWQGLLDLTVTDSNIIAVARQHYPHLNIGFPLPNTEQLAWAFPPSNDTTVYNIAVAYLDELKENGELQHLVERYYGTTESFNYINVSQFRKRVDTVLPQYESLFKEAEAITGIDWRLLAAQAYQESQWDPHAISPTGVRGIMQLTQITARELNIENRRDPRASILGGGRYLYKLTKRIDPDIPEPDRTWFALAAYNIGYGHFQDARKLARLSGKDPDKWVEVKEFLPLLEQADWHKRTRHGHARGGEAVAYVVRIRTFYDVLVKMASEQKTELLKLSVPAL